MGNILNIINSDEHFHNLNDFGKSNYMKCLEGTFLSAEVKPHFDESYTSYRDTPYRKYRYIKLNFNLKNTKGGNFICGNAYINNRFFAVYEPDIQNHAFDRVSKGTKLVLSFGILV